ncbi:MAG: haloacid dehalogenase-like hydrolase [Deltaproteobacteria bacterium]|nr:haloacid dehalogenase-like hydrolase [Deltaproteobacteria bacterium]
MRIGIDFDNTIICYDRVFNAVGIEKGLVPESLETGKGFVRDYLRKEGKEKEWIWLQGYVYGARLPDANLYDGVEKFLGYCKSRRIECIIISHKTVYPYSGDKYNLHNTAREWIRKQNIGLKTFFELTKENKIQRISDLDCSVFIDDLPEFLSLPGFPESLTKILFDPLKKYSESDNIYHYATSFKDILAMIKEWI